MVKNYEVMVGQTTPHHRNSRRNGAMWKYLGHHFDAQSEIRIFRFPSFFFFIDKQKLSEHRHKSTLHGHKTDKYIEL